MISVSLPTVKGPNGEKIYRHRYVDDIQVVFGIDKDRRLQQLLQLFVSQVDLWRLPQTGAIFDKMKIECVDGRWTIELEKR